MPDLHLEVGQQYTDFEIRVNAPCLILASDCGRLKVSAADVKAIVEMKVDDFKHIVN